MANKLRKSCEVDFVMGSTMSRFLKEAFDRILALVALLMLLPILIVIGISIKLSDPRYPIFFQQEVMGKGCTKFNFLKFRTMVPHVINYDLRKSNSNSNHGEIALDDPRVTRIGRWLRRFKLDELPQFLHVLIGEMSLVGPRPMDPIRFEHSDEFDRQRLLVKPGLTGLAQVGGNTKRTWKERMQMDVWYIVNWSILLDFEILYMTLGVVLFGEHLRESFFTRKITDGSFRILANQGEKSLKYHAK